MESDTPAPPTPRKTAIQLVGGIYCTICHSTFEKKKDYDTHYYEHGMGREQVVYTCVICRKDITGYPSFRGHCYSIHVIKGRFKCEICSKFFSKLTALNEHISTMHKFECSSCKREFPSKKELQLHKIIHMNDKPPFQCMSCNEKVDCVDACEQHIDMHSVSMYSCPICSEKINEKADAVDHLSIHFDDVLNDTDDDSENEVEPFDKPEDSSIDLIGGIFCIICKTIHKNRAELDQHYALQHPDTAIVYSCIVCLNNYEKYSQFGNHCYEHISKNRFKCEWCPRAFSRLPRLVAHASAVHGQRSCAREWERSEAAAAVAAARWCRQCGLALHARAAAARHLDVHRKKLFACPVCARQYHEKYLLMKHLPQHFEAVFHVCKICGNLYTAKNRLVEHAKIHARVKSYSCAYCAKGFTSQYKLRQHQNMHTGERPHECVACARAFANYSNLCKHLQRVHRLDPRATRRARQQAAGAGGALLAGDGLRDAWLLAAAPPPAPAPARRPDNGNYSDLCEHLQRVHRLDPRATRRARQQAAGAGGALLAGDGLRDAWLLAAAPPPAPAPARRPDNGNYSDLCEHLQRVHRLDPRATRRARQQAAGAGGALLAGDGLRDAWLLAAAPPPAPAPARRPDNGNYSDLCEHLQRVHRLDPRATRRARQQAAGAGGALLAGDGLRDAWLLAAAPPPAPAPARRPDNGNYSDLCEHLQRVHRLDPRATRRARQQAAGAGGALLAGDGLRDAWLLAAAPPPAPAPARRPDNGNYSDLCEHLQRVHRLDPRATRRARQQAAGAGGALLAGDGLRDAWLLAAAPPPAPAPARRPDNVCVPRAGEAQMPREYGPDCARRLLALDDVLADALPAVDPRLAAPAAQSASFAACL